MFCLKKKNIQFNLIVKIHSHQEEEWRDGEVQRKDNADAEIKRRRWIMHRRDKGWGEDDEAGKG